VEGGSRGGEEGEGGGWGECTWMRREDVECGMWEDGEE